MLFFVEVYYIILLYVLQTTTLIPDNVLYNDEYSITL